MAASSRRPHPVVTFGRHARACGGRPPYTQSSCPDLIRSSILLRESLAGKGSCEADGLAGAQTSLRSLRKADHYARQGRVVICITLQDRKTSEVYHVGAASD